MFAMHIWHIEEAIFVLSGGVLRNRDGKCREAATLQLLWGSVVASMCCWFLCIYLRSDCGHHHCKTSLFLAVSFSQLPSCFICPYQWEIPFPVQGMWKKPRSPPLSCSHEDMSSSCAALLPSEEGSLLLVWVCQTESGEEHSRGSWEAFPWPVFFSGILRLEELSKRCLHTPGREDLLGPV